MAITDKIISFWKRVRLKSSDMFTLFKVGIGVKLPTHILHVKDKTDPIKVEGVQSDTSSSTKFLVLDDNDVVKHATGAGKTDEEIQDIVGAMFTSNTETRIAATYEDSDGTIDLVVDTIPPDLTQSGTGTVHADNITDLHGAGVSGSANQLLTDDGDGTVTSESNLTFNSNTLDLGGDDQSSATIRRQPHSDEDGGQLIIRAGDGTGTNKDGGDLRLHAGYGTGIGTPGVIKLTATSPGSSGSTQHGEPLLPNILISETNTYVYGTLQVIGDASIFGNDIIFEGTDTSDAHQTTLSGGNPTADRTITLPDVTGTVALTSSDITGNAATATTATTATTLAPGVTGSTGDVFTFQSATSLCPIFQIKNTNTDASSSRLRFVKDKGVAGADNDVIGAIEFYADDDTQVQTHFAKIEAEIKDASNGGEEGKLTLSIASHDGEMQPGLIIESGDTEDSVEVTLGTVNSSGHLNINGGLGRIRAMDQGGGATNIDYEFGTVDNTGFISLMPYTQAAGRTSAQMPNFGITLSNHTPTGTDQAGKLLVLTAGKATGNAAPGNINMQVFKQTGASGTSVNDTDGGYHYFAFDDVEFFKFATPQCEARVTIHSNNTTSTTGGQLMFKKNAADTEDGEVLGSITFYGEDEGNNNTQFAEIVGSISESDDGTEGGKIELNVASHDGELVTGILVEDGDAEDEVDVTIGSTTTSLTTIAGDIQINGNDIKDSSGNANTLPGAAGTLQHQGEATGQHFQVVLKDMGSFMFYIFHDDNWYSAGSSTLAILGSSTSPSNLSTSSSRYAGRIAIYTAIANCTIKKLQFTFYWSSSAVNAADFDFAFSKFTPITDGSSATTTMNSITATDCNGSYTENVSYQKTFTFSGGNASLSAGDALAFHMRTTGGSSSQRVLVYGTAVLSVELS